MAMVAFVVLALYPQLLAQHAPPPLFFGGSLTEVDCDYTTIIRAEVPSVLHLILDLCWCWLFIGIVLGLNDQRVLAFGRPVTSIPLESLWHSCPDVHCHEDAFPSLALWLLFRECCVTIERWLRFIISPVKSCFWQSCGAPTRIYEKIQIWEEEVVFVSAVPLISSAIRRWYCTQVPQSYSTRCCTERSSAFPLVASRALRSGWPVGVGYCAHRWNVSTSSSVFFTQIASTGTACQIQSLWPKHVARVLAKRMYTLLATDSITLGSQQWFQLQRLEFACYACTFINICFLAMFVPEDPTRHHIMISVMQFWLSWSCSCFA